MTSSRVRIASEPFAPDEEAAAFRAQMPGAGGEAGAIVTFTGIVRGEGGDVQSLTLTHYEGYTEKIIEAMLAQAMDRFALTDAQIIHRVGEMRPGTPIVFVATAAPHRRAAFEANDFLMDFLKQRAPFWKKQRTSAGTVWIEPTDQDREDLARWTPDDARN